MRVNSSQNFNLELSQGFTGVGQSNEAASKIFLELSEEEAELNELKKKTVQKNTISVANTSVNTFKKFCHQINFFESLEELTKDELIMNSLLKRFYAGARKNNG